MSDLSLNEFPKKLSPFFTYKNEVYPRGGFLVLEKGVVLLGATMNYVVGLSQIRNDLSIVKITNLNQYIPLVPRANVTTIDDLLLYAYKVIFTPYYGEIIKGNKTLAVGIIFTRYVTNKRASYWIYDPESGTINKLDIGDMESIIVKYVEIPEDEISKIIPKIFNISGLKEQLRRYIAHGLFILDSVGE